MANRNFARVMRRKTQWAGFGNAAAGALLPTLTSVASGGTVILSTGVIISGAQGLVEEETTMTRMIGRITVGVNLDTALASGAFAIGCVVVRGEAISAGVASMPSPETDPDAEWLYYVSGLCLNPQNALRDGPASTQVVEFDVRGQRIVRAGSNLVWLLAARTSGIHAQVSGRYLLKLT